MIRLLWLFSWMAVFSSSNPWYLQSEGVQVPESFQDCWSIVILPDIQCYSETYLGLLELQATWVKNNADRIHANYVLLPGDITNHNTDPEWENASAALAILDREVPYAMCPGNHDCGENGWAGDRTTKMDTYFPYERFAGWSGIAEVKTKGHMANTCHFFTAGNNEPWMIVSLEWSPTDETLSWAGTVLTAHKERKAIVMTHAYLYYDSTLYDWASKGEEQEWNPHSYPTQNGNDGQEIWDKLIRHHDNVLLVISGHVLGDGTGVLVSSTDAGNPVIQMLINYQSPIHDMGGQAWLRVLTFRNDMSKITCWTYSPLFHTYREEGDQLFEFIKK